MGSDGRTGCAIKRGARGGELDKRRQAQTKVAALGAHLKLLGTQAGVIHQFEQAVQTGVVRQATQVHAIGAGGAMLGRDAVIAPAQFGRVQAQRGRARVHQLLGDGASHRLAHAPVRAHRGFVLVGHAQLRLQHRPRIGRTDQGHGLHAFEHAGAREHGIGANVHQVVHRKAQHLALRIERQLGVDAVRARMHIAVEGFKTVADEFHRLAQQNRSRHGGHLVVVHMQLDAKGATHIGGEHAHIGLAQTKQLRQQGAHLLRHLRRLVDREVSAGRVKLGDDGAPLQRYTGVAGVNQLALNHAMRFCGHCGKTVAADLMGQGQVAAQAGVDQRAVGLQSGGRIDHRRAFFPSDVDQGHGVFGHGAAGGHHQHHRLALPMALAIGQRALGRAAVLGQGGQGGGPGLANAGQIAGLPNPAHTGECPGRAQVRCRPTGMCPRAAQKGRVQQTGHAQIVGVAATSGHIAARALARQALADPIVGLGRCIHAGLAVHAVVVGRGVHGAGLTRGRAGRGARHRRRSGQRA